MTSPDCQYREQPRKEEENPTYACIDFSISASVGITWRPGIGVGVMTAVDIVDSSSGRRLVTMITEGGN